MAESTAVEQSTSPRTSEFVAFNAPHLGIRPLEYGLAA